MTLLSPNKKEKMIEDPKWEITQSKCNEKRFCKNQQKYPNLRKKIAKPIKSIESKKSIRKALTSISFEEFGQPCKRLTLSTGSAPAAFS